MAASEVSSQSEYIQHHLVNLNSLGGPQLNIANFHVIDYDALFWSIVTGAIVVYFLWRAARAANTGVPGRFQVAVEMLVDWVEDEAKSIVPNEKSRAYVAPLCLTIFLWTTLMNALDLVPVDLFAWIFKLLGLASHHSDVFYYHRLLPTADLNVPMGMSLAVLLLTFYYGFKIKKPIGFFKDLFTSPFHAHGVIPVIILLPFNLALNVLEYIAKTVSLGMRLFGNMFAGELLFMLIALLGGAWTGFNGVSLSLGIGQILAGSVWAIFHVLIVLLQAYIFMMLSMVYVGLAHESH